MKIFLKKVYAITLTAMIISVFMVLPAFAAVEKVYEAEGDELRHNDNLGKADGDGWLLEGNGNSGHAIYGPYAKDIPTGSLIAKFYIKLTEEKGDPENRIFNLDARDATADKMLAEKAVTKGDFKKIGEYQVIVMPFENTTAGNELEFRVWYDGNVGAKIDKLVISDTENLAPVADNPKTGDVGIAAWLMVAVISGAVFFVIMRKTKKTYN